MAVTFAGKQPGYADPKLVHEPLAMVVKTGLEFSGKQPGQADPTVYVQAS